MLGIVLRPQALHDLEAIGRFIGADNPKRGESYVQELHTFIDGLADFPHIYPAVPELDDARLAQYGKYHIYYRITATQLFVVRVLHSARDIAKNFNT
ncbi:MAG: type II toxin-antitoxin system RelE/ParE family toxin [Rickettsiales bacterium]